MAVTAVVATLQEILFRIYMQILFGGHVNHRSENVRKSTEESHQIRTFFIYIYIFMIVKLTNLSIKTMSLDY